MGWPKAHPALVVALSLLSANHAALAQASADMAGRTVCCKDGARQICGDTMPSQCVGKAYRILDRNGNLIRESAAPLTTEQKEQKAQEARQKQEDEKKQREQFRKDQALLDTYASLDQLDRTRQRYIDGINQGIKQSEDKITAARKRLQDYERRAQQTKPVPSDVQNGLRDADAEIKMETLSLENKRRDLVAVRERFDSERKRYVELTTRKP